ncbi:MAG TPA: HAD family hydrolase [Firmicutes bacterium]|nr:HAD family hydrolase [Bacillota bacterium]
MVSKAILFDLDGTLWDSSEAVSASWNEVTESLEHPFPVTTLDMKRTMGLTMDKIADILFSPYVRKEDIPLLQKKCEEAENVYLRSHPGILFQGVRETLSLLSKEYSLYIVSNCQKGYIEAFLAGTKLGSCFKGHLCYGDTLAPKGKTIEILLRREGIRKAVYVGDTSGDMEAAHFASLPFIHAAYGFGETKGEEAEIASFQELPSVLKNFF